VTILRAHCREIRGLAKVLLWHALAHNLMRMASQKIGLPSLSALA